VPLVLDLLRHGHALPAADGGDAERKLSERGRADIERVATRLRDLGWRPARAFTSPLPRARLSALIALRVAAPELAPEVMDALRPETDPREALAAIEEVAPASGHLLAAGHQPLLGLLAALLTGGPAPSLPTAGLVRIEFRGALSAGAGVITLTLAP
jgi:phosphohistidine phosphatase SixA